MGEMVSYIFRTLGNTDAAVQNIRKNLKLQGKFNRRVALFAALTAAYVVVNEQTIRKQNNEIKKLKDEIAKLKEPVNYCMGSTESKG